MAEVVVGDVIARLRADAQQFNQAIQQAIQRLGQLSQAVTSVRQQQNQTQQAATQQVQGLRNVARAAEDTAASVRRAGSAMQTAFAVAGGIGIATSIGAIASSLANFARSTVDVGTRMEGLRATFSALAGSTGIGLQHFQQLFATAQQLGVAFEPLARGWRTLTAAATQANLPIADQQRLLTALATEARRTGASNQELERAILAVGQMASKGKVSMEELRQQLGEALPTALAAAARGMGRTTEELTKLVETGRVSFVPFAQAITRGFEQMQRGSGDFASTAQTAFNRLGNALLAFKDTVAQNVLPELERLARIATGILETATGIVRAAGGRTGGPVGPSAAEVTQASPAQSKELERLTHIIRTLEAQLQAPNQTDVMRRTREDQLARAREQREELVQALSLTQDQAKAQAQVTQEANKTADALARQKAFNDEFAKTTAQIKKDTEAFRAQAALAPERFGRPTGSVEDIEKFNKNLQEIIGKQVEGLATLVQQRGDDIRLTNEQRQALSAYDKQYGQLEKTIDAARDAEQRRKQAAAEALSEQRRLAREAAQEQEQATERLAQLQATLARAQTFLGRPNATAAQEARARIEQEGAAIQASIVRAIELIKQAPTVRQLAPDILSQFEEALSQLPSVIEREGGQAFERAIERQFMEPLRRLGERFNETGGEANAFMEAIRLAAQVAGTSFEQEAERIVRQFERLHAIETLFPGVNDPGRRSPDIPATSSMESLKRQLDQMRQRGVLGTADRLRAQARESGELLTSDREMMLRLIDAQERFNSIMDATTRIGESMAQSLTSGLISIVDGTQKVGEGFKSMAKAILDATAQILVSEGFRTLLRLGLNLLAGAIAPGAGAAVGVGAIGGTSAFGASTPAPVFGGATGFQHGGIVDRPTLALIGENPATSPEYVLNRHQMHKLVQTIIEHPSHAPTAVETASRRTRTDGTTERPMREQLHQRVRHFATEALQGAVRAVLPQGLRGEMFRRQTATVRHGDMPISTIMPFLDPQKRQGVLDMVRHQVGPQAMADIPRFQHGGMVNRPTLALIGENPATSPEYVFNRQQMNTLMASAMRGAPSAGGQAAGGISIINVNSREQGEAQAARERAMGKQVVMNYIMEELAQGSGSGMMRLINMQRG